MKPETYVQYSLIFDRFSSEKLFPAQRKFIDNNVKYSDFNSKIIELGGGSAYYTKKFLNSVSSRNYTFVELSKDMIAIAKKRLPRYVKVLNDDALSAIETLKVKQSLFVFQRSLYSFYGSIEEYRPLVKAIYKNAQDGAVVAISEMVEQYDLKQLYDYFYANRNLLGLEKDEDFSRDWKILEDVLNEYNYNVKNGVFTHLSESNLKPLFESEGFKLIETFDTNFYFQKIN